MEMTVAPSVPTPPPPNNGIISAGK